jgi:SAM-dependent methyltransferase
MTDDTSHTCRICGNREGNQPFIAREMYFGWKDQFEYFECANCGCVQIDRIPDDLDRYYPSHYYSYAPPANVSIPKVPAWRRLRNRALLGRDMPLSRLLARLARPPGYFSWFDGLELDLDARILDVGCGAGSLLLRMRKAGFSNLSGVDPYISGDIDYGNGLRIRKSSLADIVD